MANTTMIAQGVARREQIIAFMLAYLERQGMAPTQREVAAGIGLSERTTRKHLHVLAGEGRIRLAQGPRAINVIKNPPPQ